MMDVTMLLSLFKGHQINLGSRVLNQRYLAGDMGLLLGLLLGLSEFVSVYESAT